MAGKYDGMKATTVLKHAFIHPIENFGF